MEGHSIAYTENINDDAKIFMKNGKSLPQDIIAIKTMEKGTPKIAVPVKYQK